MPDWTAFRAELSGQAYQGLSDADAAALANAPDPANPVPKPFAFADVMGLLSPSSVANVRSLPTGTDLIDKINEQDRPGVSHWVGALLAPPALITTGEATAVSAVLSATVPGPSRAAQTFGIPVTEWHVAHARSLA